MDVKLEPESVDSGMEGQLSFVRHFCQSNRDILRLCIVGTISAESYDVDDSVSVIFLSVTPNPSQQQQQHFLAFVIPPVNNQRTSQHHEDFVLVTIRQYSI